MLCFDSLNKTVEHLEHQAKLAEVREKHEQSSPHSQDEADILATASKQKNFVGMAMLAALFAAVALLVRLVRAGTP